MSYKYQQDILSTLHEDVERRIENKNYIRKGQQNLADMHRCDTKRMANELNEVYAKAEAFDAVLRIFNEEYIQSESRNRPYEFITAMRDLIAEYLIAEYESEAE